MKLILRILLASAIPAFFAASFVVYALVRDNTGQDFCEITQTGNFCHWGSIAVFWLVVFTIFNFPALIFSSILWITKPRSRQKTLPKK